MNSGTGAFIRFLKNLHGRLPRDRIRTGTNRFVVLCPDKGIVIKFPLLTIFSKPQEDAQRKAIPLLKGKHDNAGEYFFWNRLRHPFCTPTLGCWGNGLVNVQRLGIPLGIDFIDFVQQIAAFGGLEVDADRHHFHNIENFCKDAEKRICMVDYGESRTQAVIQLKGEQIQQKFDFSYCFLRSRGFSEDRIREFYERGKRPKTRQK